MDITLTTKDNEIWVSSREVAENFGKKHSEVIYAIEGRVAYDKKKGKEVVKHTGILMGGHDQLLHMFHKADYVDGRGRSQYEYLMNRDGFSLLVMGFTGKEALEWKLKYIDAFNKMEETIRNQNSRMLPTTYKEALLQLIEQVEKNEQLEKERKVLLPKAEYHDEVLNKDNLITTTVIAKDLGFKSAAKLNTVMYMNKIIFKNQGGTWCPYADYEWLITDGYADFQSYKNENANPILKWTEKGRKWILENYEKWVELLK